MANQSDDKIYESTADLHSAVERRLGRSLDESTRAALDPDWAPPYDNADLTELLQRARRVGVRKVRRRQHGNFRAWIDDVDPRAIDYHVSRARSRLDMDKDNPNESASPIRAITTLMLGTLAMLLREWGQNSKEDIELLDLVLGQQNWWCEFVREVVYISRLHRIPEEDAYLLLAGQHWGPTRKRRRLVDELDAVPEAVMRSAISMKEDIDTRVREKVAKEMDRRFLMRVFLKATDWQPSFGPPLGGWEYARQMFNKTAGVISPRTSLFSSTEAFRAAARRSRSVVDTE